MENLFHNLPLALVRKIISYARPHYPFLNQLKYIQKTLWKKQMYLKYNLFYKYETWQDVFFSEINAYTERYGWRVYLRYNNKHKEWVWEKKGFVNYLGDEDNIKYKSFLVRYNTDRPAYIRQLNRLIRSIKNYKNEKQFSQEYKNRIAPILFHHFIFSLTMRMNIPRV